MSRALANVETTVDTFGTLIAKVNELTYAFSHEVVTANATYANTGNTGTPRIAQVIGTVGANTLVATGAIRGGNVSSSANLNLTSNLVITGAAFSSSANSLYTNTQFFTANIQANGALLTVQGSSLNVTSNVTVTANSIALKSNSSVTALNIAGNSTATNTTVTSTTFNLNSNLAISGTAHTVGGNVNFDSNVLFINAANNSVCVGTTTATANLTVAGTANVTSNMKVGGTLVVNGALTFANVLGVGNTTVTGFVNVTSTAAISGATSINNTLASGNTTVTGFINVSSSANVGGTLSATGAATLANTLSVGGTATFQTEYVVDVSSNTNIGNNAAPRVVYSFPKATYKGGEIIAVATNTGNNQLSKMAVIHDNTDAYVTVYGVVASPLGANNDSPLGTYSANINNANVEILMTQTYSNSAVKIVAHLIK